MVLEAKEKDKIIVSFSSSVGNIGIKRIKNYIEFLEIGSASQKTISKKEINTISDEVTAKAWQKMAKKRKL